jgi:putative NADH-flavin reductase
VISAWDVNAFRSPDRTQHAAIVPAMERAGVRHLILVSAFGVGESRRDAPLIPRIMYRVLLSDIFADKKAAEDNVRRSNLDWTFVYPVLLSDGPTTGAYRVGERLELRGVPKISRADVAHFIVSELESARLCASRSCANRAFLTMPLESSFERADLLKLPVGRYCESVASIRVAACHPEGL